jgi:hypothetical protein
MFGIKGPNGVTGGCTFISTTGDTIHVAAHPFTPDVLEVDIQGNANDNINGSNYSITSYYRTRWIDAGSYSQRKMFRRPDVVVKQADVASELTLDIYIDYEESVKTKSYDVSIPTTAASMLWGTSYWGIDKWGAANVGSQIINGRSIGLAKSIQLEFSGTAGVLWGINSFTLKYNPRKVTK